MLKKVLFRVNYVGLWATREKQEVLFLVKWEQEVREYAEKVHAACR